MNKVLLKCRCGLIQRHLNPRYTTHISGQGTDHSTITVNIYIIWFHFLVFCYFRQWVLCEFGLSPDIQWNCQFNIGWADMPTLGFPASPQAHLHWCRVIPRCDTRGSGKLLPHARWQWLAMVFNYYSRDPMAVVQLWYKHMQQDITTRYLINICKRNSPAGIWVLF